MAFSRFDHENWHLPTGSEHKLIASIQSRVTKSDRDADESASGCHYSVLLSLPYFDAPKMLIVEPCIIYL